jgi:predicted MFS family arabinose efflux permease
VLFLIYMLDYVDRMVVTGMLFYIKRDWGISDQQAGWLVSIVIIFITVFSIPAAIFIDRWSRRKMIAIMTGFWSLATLACAFTRSYTQLLVARAFIGIGEAGYAPAGTALLSAAYPEKKRARVMGIWYISIPLGIGIGMAMGGLIARYWGWKHAFGLVSIPGFLLAVWAWRLPDYKTVRTPGSVIHRAGLWANAVGILRTPSALFTFLGFAMNVSITTGLTTWLPTYFERTGFATRGNGGMYATPVFALVLVGAPLGGYLSDRWQKSSSRGRLLFPALSSLAAAVLLGVAFMAPQGVAQMVLLGVFGIVLTLFLAPAVAVTQDVVHPGLRALSYSLCVIVQHTAGDAWSPPLIGLLSDAIGLQSAVLFLPVYGVLAAIFFYLASRYYERDLARVERVSLVSEG